MSRMAARAFCDRCRDAISINMKGGGMRWRGGEEAVLVAGVMAGLEDMDAPGSSQIPGLLMTNL